ncbi:MAG: hypothetical protein J0I00_18970 [Burkholderiales bacterium]|uniref:hypothetical protein n=1 Tax=Ottowia sp. TaxID=1898956 RepID=UPI001ACA5A5E|nr:hypothetical protein [Ottowia sp.]MBN9407479.1 hypothetical protein [Burkholderiales bacterium]
MSNTAFVESQSADPVEQAIARKVLRLLNDKTLERQQRIELVRQAQRQLLGHQRQQREATELAARVSATALPKGYRAVSVQVRRGLVQVGAASDGGFAWVDAGPVPEGLAANLPPRPLNAVRQVPRRPRIDPIAARRRELQARQA